jgi:hypothetical protein
MKIFGVMHVTRHVIAMDIRSRTNKVNKNNQSQIRHPPNLKLPILLQELLKKSEKSPKIAQSTAFPQLNMILRDFSDFFKSSCNKMGNLRLGG